MEQKNLPGIQNNPGRPKKYNSEIERKTAHRRRQRAYRDRLLQEGKKMLDGSKESSREYTVTLPIGSFITLKDASQLSNSDLLSQVIEISATYVHAKKAGKKEAEAFFIQKTNNLYHL
ncbi:MAG: hypothetical protein AAB356_02635 [Deltaproteobacteria bacterium]